MCAEQGIALRGHRQQGSSNNIGKKSDTERTMQRGNFPTNAFAALDPVLMEHLVINAKMVSWQVQNDIIECLSEFVWSKIKD